MIDIVSHCPAESAMCVFTAAASFSAAAAAATAAGINLFSRLVYDNGRARQDARRHISTTSHFP